MKAQAIWNNQVIAETDLENILHIEGNYYFPPESVKKEFLTDSNLHTTCPWKGEASYYNVVANGETNADAAWYYPVPKAGSTEVVKQQNGGKNNGDFSNYIAFWRGVEVKEVE